MFEQLIESSSRKRQSKRRWLYFAATAAIWIPGLVAVILGGVLAYDGRLSDQYGHHEKLGIFIPMAPSGGPAAPKPPPTTGPQHDGALVAPRVTPTTITRPSIDPPVIASIGSIDGPGRGPAGPGGGGGPNGDDSYGSPFGLPGAPPGGAAPAPAPAPPPAPKKDEAPATPAAKPRVSIMLQGTAVRRVEPPYPGIAKQVHASGPVVVEVVVDETGGVLSARALSGHPLLRKAAEDAARGWKWNPTKLNNIPVQVIGTITFNFVL